MRLYANGKTYTEPGKVKPVYHYDLAESFDVQQKKTVVM